MTDLKRAAMQAALEAVETVFYEALERRFPECCGHPQGTECCGNWNEAWTPTDNRILDILSPVQRQLSDALRAALAEPEPVAWTPVGKAMPKSGVVVLACYRNRLGNSRRIRAHWIAAKTEEADGDFDYGEYDEETDRCWAPEGWYECIDNWADYSSVAVCEGEVTHWMPLPPEPGAALAEPKVEQEPVAWCIPEADQFCWAKKGSRPFALAWKPLYTTPPLREWVGLTDEERQQILDSTHPDNRWTLAERVEYRLKERNA